MTHSYQVRIWHEDGWWLARVMAASDDADTSALNALTQARSLARIEPMARDLIATILDANEDSFDVKFEYLLPGESGDLVCQAKGARAWLDAAQTLWQERSATAARALAEEGYSLRETATLLGLSHQRVDQILGSHPERRQSDFFVFCEGSSDTTSLSTDPHDDVVPVFVVMSGRSAGSWVIGHGHGEGEELRNQFKTLLREAVSRVEANPDSTDQRVPNRDE